MKSRRSAPAERAGVRFARVPGVVALLLVISPISASGQVSSSLSTGATKSRSAVTPEAATPWAMGLSLSGNFFPKGTQSDFVQPTVTGAAQQPEAGPQGDLQPTGWSKEGHLSVKDRDEIPTRLVRFDVERRKIVEDQAISPEDPTGVVTVPRILPTPDGKTMVHDYRRMLDDLYLVCGLGALMHFSCVLTLP